MPTINEIPPTHDDGGVGGGGSGSVGPGSGTSGPATNILRIFDPNPDQRAQNLDFEIKWSYITKTQKPGKIALSAKIGDVITSMDRPRWTYNLGDDVVFSSSEFVLRKQIGPNLIEELEVFGLQFVNWVYGGKSVTINVWDAFYKEDEEGFIIPINQQLLRAMSLKDSTQLSYETQHLVINAYQVVKKKWYQRTWFRILIIVIAIIITFMTWGADGGATMSAAANLAYAAAVSLGFVGLMALFIAATFYVLAAMVLTQLLTPVVADAFGEEWGPIIAYVISAFVMGGANAFSSVKNSVTNLSKVTASNIMAATSAVLSTVGTLYGKVIQGKMDALGGDYEDLAKMKSEFESRQKEIDKLSKELLGSTTDTLDISGFIEASAIQVEAAQDFLSRTLLTGSDVVEITNGLVNNFAELGLQLPTNG